MTRQERNDMYARIDDEWGRDDCAPSFIPAAAKISAAFWIAIAIIIGAVRVFWGL